MWPKLSTTAVDGQQLATSGHFTVTAAAVFVSRASTPGLGARQPLSSECWGILRGYNGWPLRQADHSLGGVLPALTVCDLELSIVRPDLGCCHEGGGKVRTRRWHLTSVYLALCLRKHKGNSYRVGSDLVWRGCQDLVCKTWGSLSDWAFEGTAFHCSPTAGTGDRILRDCVSLQSYSWHRRPHSKGLRLTPVLQLAQETAF